MTEATDVIYTFGDHVLDPRERKLIAHGVEVRLQAKEFETLLLLVENSGRALTKEEMLAGVWGDTFVEENALAKYISRLRKLLDSGETSYIETLPKHGYRFSAGIRREARPAIAEAFGVRSIDKLTVRVQEPVRLLSTKTSRAVVFCGAALLLVAGAALWYFRPLLSPRRPMSVAIQPFVATKPDAEQQAIGLGLSDAVTTKLGRVPGVVIRHVSLSGDNDAIDLGRRLGVDAVLNGTIQRFDDRIRLNVRLVRVSSGEQIWSEQFDEAENDIFALEDALSGTVARALQFEINREELKSTSSRPTENIDAYQRYLTGRFYQAQRTRDGLTKSLELYKEAISLDPNFALAYAGIADANVTMYNFAISRPEQAIPETRANAQKALELDQNCASALLTNAQLAFLYERDGTKAEGFYKRSIELDPSNRDSYLRYGHFLASSGRFDEAMTNLEKARDLDPLSPMVQADMGLVDLYRRQYASEIDRLRRTVADNPQLPILHWFLGDAYEMTGDAERSFEFQMRAFELEGSASLAQKLRAIKASRGLNAAYKAWLDENIRRRETEFVPAMEIAFVAAILKDRDQTLNWLEIAARDREPTVPQLRYFGRYDFLRADPRFHQILAEIELR
ncbi:MAG: winged helix-turn-helix domain-containing protein [Acidobacteria bacterium]|nr:winged helix-turn-helix domain-containing protein [Acidobacteriota bacterium]